MNSFIASPFIFWIEIGSGSVNERGGLAISNRWSKS